MSDFHALIRACKDEPDDDAPRLVLADWLDEHGDEDRAAFIRLTVGKSARRWSTEATELLEKMLPHWLDVFGVNTVAGPDPGTDAGLFYVRQVRRIKCVLRRDKFARTSQFAITFERGFVERIRVGVYDFRAVVPLLLRAHPLAQVEANDLRVYVPDIGKQAPLRIDVGMAWVGNEVFEELYGFDEWRPVDPPYHYANTPIKRFRIKSGELANAFRKRVTRAICEAMTVAGQRIAINLSN